MIIYTIEIQDGERQYTEWDYVDHHYEDYENGNLTDQQLLEDFFGVELSNQDLEHSDRYWINGERIAYIGKVNSIEGDHLELIRRYV
tara:strand:- start:38 stop:298 length:261 start_codon:yes stop_codon:yes gene_type:complete